ncbi:MAG: hypothetical protein JWO46_752 [Nocardioidaceae bacterium]|nr:hypothetical protein [Nocardioidaceae bacterium]
MKTIDELIEASSLGSTDAKAAREHAGSTAARAIETSWLYEYETRNHHPGLINPNWPLCDEAEAVQRGWTQDQIEDGELAFDPVVARPVTCTLCLELRHA